MAQPDLRPVTAAEPATDAAGRARPLALVLGALTGLLGLLGMLRLAAGAFEGAMSGFAWVVVLAAMLPWVGYVAWRAQHGRLSRRGLLLVAALVALGAATVWLDVLGPVLALACSLGAFAVIWVSDWPSRRPRGQDRMVSIEELQRDEEPDAA
jgi:hypothetical protein